MTGWPTWTVRVVVLASKSDGVSELRRGAFELALLAFLDREESFSGAIIDGLRQATGGGLSVTEGALYPALVRLEKKGLLTSENRRDIEGRKPRKYYSLTDAGRERLALLKEAWIPLVEGIEMLFGGE